MGPIISFIEGTSLLKHEYKFWIFIEGSASYELFGNLTQICFYYSFILIWVNELLQSLKEPIPSNNY